MKNEYRLWAAAGMVLWIGFLVWLWQPERQVRLHQKHLLKAVASRNWNKVAAMMAEDYSDRWGGHRTETTSIGRDGFRHFLSLSVQSELVSMEGGRVVERIRLSGQGSPVAEMIMERVNSLSEPFTFEWVHRSSKPWDYQLLKVDHPTLSIESANL